MSIVARINKLENQVKPEEPKGVVVIYDPETGRSLMPIPDDAPAIIILPDNKRDPIKQELAGNSRKSEKTRF